MPIQYRRVINHSWQNPAWHWLAHALPEVEWLHFTRQALTQPHSEFGRSLLTAFRAVQHASVPGSLLVSHGPLPAVYAGLFRALTCGRMPHLVYAFNFTELPRGFKRQVMGWALRRATRLVVFSSMEKRLYAEHFGIPEERIDFVPWAAKPLPSDRHPEALPDQDFICAIGSQGRDYSTLMGAMQQLPQIRLVLVAHPDNLSGLTIPENVQVYTRLPIEQIGIILRRSRFMVLPLATSEIPCGHVTLVSAFHADRAVVVTGSSGIQDYVQNDVNGKTVPPRDAHQLAQAIQTLWADRKLSVRLGQEGGNYARAHCTESSVIGYFKGFLQGLERP
jgi:glycosyltransferase involved in cell wall biosynthesis